MLGGMSIVHWLLVLVIVVLVFGTKKLRNLGEDLGGAVRGFKQGLKDGGETPPAAAPADAAHLSDGKTVDGQAREKKD